MLLRPVAKEEKEAKVDRAVAPRADPVVVAKVVPAAAEAARADPVVAAKVDLAGRAAAEADPAAVDLADPVVVREVEAPAVVVAGNKPNKHKQHSFLSHS